MSFFFYSSLQSLCKLLGCEPPFFPISSCFLYFSLSLSNLSLSNSLNLILYFSLMLSLNLYLSPKLSLCLTKLFLTQSLSHLRPSPSLFLSTILCQSLTLSAALLSPATPCLSSLLGGVGVCVCVCVFIHIVVLICFV